MKTKAYGTHDIARVCHVTPPTVGRWIAEGLLPSFSTGGGHRRVWDEDLAGFFKGAQHPGSPRNGGSAGPPAYFGGGRRRPYPQTGDPNVAADLPDVEYHEAGDGFEAGRKISELVPTLVIWTFASRAWTEPKCANPFEPTTG
jgi:hypothetical protein